MCSSLPKILAMYLPQFHEIPENNTWWGNGFTEWTNVKKAYPLFRGHLQPRVPYMKNYYDLSNHAVMNQQMQMALKFGIDGFCIYHYWFKGNKLLEGPLERLLDEEKIVLPFCICWANEAWTRTWDGDAGSKQILIAQEYGGEEDWIYHFEYLNQFFQRPEYIKVQGKPLLVLYAAYEIKQRDKMLRKWNELAKNRGFNGIFVVNTLRGSISEQLPVYGDGIFDFEPFATLSKINQWQRGKIEKIYRGNRMQNYDRLYKVLDFDGFCELMTERFTGTGSNHYLGMFAGWDNTPRRGIQTSLIYENNTPEIFEKYFSIQYKRSIELQNDFLFINAWNEWGEGTVLEPDEKYIYGYLEAILNVKRRLG